MNNSDWEPHHPWQLVRLVWVWQISLISVRILWPNIKLTSLCASIFFLFCVLAVRIKWPLQSHGYGSTSLGAYFFCLRENEVAAKNICYNFGPPFAFLVSSRNNFLRMCKIKSMLPRMPLRQFRFKAEILIKNRTQAFQSAQGILMLNINALFEYLGNRRKNIALGRLISIKAKIALSKWPVCIIEF